MIDKLLVSQAELAGFINLSPRRVRDLDARGIFQKGENKKYDLRKCNHAFIAYLREQISGAGNISLVDARTRRELARAELTELELKERRGELILRDDGLQAYRLIIGEGRVALLGLPRRICETVAAISDPKEEEFFLRGEVNRILDGLTRGDFAKDKKKRSAKKEKGESHEQR